MEHIIPTPGRIVWYRGADGAIRAAIVAAVHGPFCATLHVFGLSAVDVEAGLRASITHADPEIEPNCFPSWHWMPYQKQQAEKHGQVDLLATHAEMVKASGWTPGDVADQQAASTLQPHQQRVVDEKAELDEKRMKLGAFFDTEIFARLPAEEQRRLGSQIYVMNAYSDILGERIAAFVPATDEARMQQHADMVRESGWKANYGDGQQNAAWAPNLKPGDGTPV